MKAGSWTGIQGVRAQDRAMTESMGILSPRQKEHLGASDVAVIRFRRRMLDAARAYAARGVVLGIDPSIPYERLRAEQKMMPIDADWTAPSDLPEPAQA